MTNKQLLPIASKKHSQSFSSALFASYERKETLNFIVQRLSNYILPAINKFFKKIKLTDFENLDYNLILSNQKIRIIDVGAADGYNPKWDLLKNCLEIYMFEPETEAYQKLKDQYASNPLRKIINAALSENGESQTFYITKWPRSSSMYRPNNKFLSKTFLANLYEIEKELKLDTTKLKEYVREADFIKLDVEGYELPILKGGGELINSLIGVELEVHFNDFICQCPSFAEIDIFMKQNEFKLIAIGEPGYWHYELPNMVYESKGFITSGDFLYLRMPETIIGLIKSGKWKKEQLAKVISIYLLLGYYEFALILVQYSIQEDILNENDDLYLNSLKLIKKRAGVNNIISYNKYKKIKHFALSKSVSLYH